MLSEYFSNVVGGEIKKINIRRGSVWNGKKLGSQSPDSSYALVGLFPQVGSKPIPGKYQTVSGPVMQWDSENRVVVKFYTVHDIPEAECLACRRQELSSLRYKKEIAGIVVAGVRVSTDRIAIARLESRMNELAKKQVGTSINWKIPGDGCLPVTSDTLRSWHEAVSEYTQLCIDRECELIEALEVNIDTDITTGWPSQEIE